MVLRRKGNLEDPPCRKVATEVDHLVLVRRALQAMELHRLVRQARKEQLATRNSKPCCSRFSV